MGLVIYTKNKNFYVLCFKFQRSNKGPTFLARSTSHFCICWKCQHKNWKPMQSPHIKTGKLQYIFFWGGFRYALTSVECFLLQLCTFCTTTQLCCSIKVILLIEQKAKILRVKKIWIRNPNYNKLHWYSHLRSTPLLADIPDVHLKSPSHQPQWSGQCYHVPTKEFGIYSFHW